MLLSPPRERGGLARSLAIYDAECRACTGFAKVVELLDVHRRINLISAQSREAQAFFSQEELRRTFHVVEPDGRALVHGGALLRVLGYLPGMAWLPALAERSRGFRRLADRLYGWLARNRPWISYLA